MTSIILTTTTRFLTPFLLTVSVFLLMRGHDLPGGGFAGGLVAVAAMALHLMAYGEPELQRIVRADPRTVVGIGLLCAIFSGLVGTMWGYPLLTSVWREFGTPLGHVKIGTPMLFDLGVYLVVVGAGIGLLEDMHEE